MKKSILCLLLVLSLCLCVVLASCKKTPPETPDDPNQSSDTLPGEKKGNVYTTPFAGGEAETEQPNEQVEDE